MTKKISIRSAVFLFSILPISVWADALVTDAVPVSASSNNTFAPAGQDFSDVPLSQDSDNSYSTHSPASSGTSLLSKVNDLQREIQRLRGQLEVQSHELTQLKEQQQAYYNDLDQRISLLASGKSKSPVLSLDTTTPTASTISTSSATAMGATASTTATPDEEASYNAAYALIEQRKFNEASIAMKAFLQKYPNGKYTANAHYWLGELLLAQHKDSEAINEFNTVIQQYPASNKVSASMLKLGFAYSNLGDTAKAKTTFLNVEKMFPDTTTAQLAHARLESLK